jgi:hypothetical protein
MIMSNQQIKKITRLTADVLALELGERSRFNGVNFAGAPVPGIAEGDMGVLPEPYRRSATEAVYAVYSYETPIGWALENGTWVVPAHKYSLTTSRQQKAVREALAALGVTVTDGL